MKIALSVYDGTTVGTAWSDVSEEHKDLPTEEIIARYVLPAFMAALDRVKEKP